MIHRHTLTWVAILALIVLMFLRLPPMVAKQDSLMNVYGPLVEVDALCRQQYVEPIRDTRLVEGAIRGMMLRLDPYSGYIAPDELAAFERRSQGDYTGVGIELGHRLGRLEVIAPIEGSPAAESGVRPGDTLLSINEVDLDGRSVFDVEEMLVGPPGTQVRIRLLHRGENEPTELVLRRDHIHVSSVRGFARRAESGWDYWIDRSNGIAYLRVGSFHGSTMAEFDAALGRLKSGRLRGLIIDLRFNPGGIMHQAIEMVNRFVADGPILATVTRRRAVDEFRATAAGTVSDVPLVVLINGGSASSSEIVAGALQVRRRAVVIGERSFGKGSVQHVIHLSERNAAVKLTTAYYRLPDGRIIHRTAKNGATDSWGVTPDVIIPLTPDEQQTIREDRQALDLAFIADCAVDPFFSDKSASAVGIGGVGLPPRRGAARSLTIDRQLEAAVDYIRATLSPQKDSPSP
jgi:carboxyl-terminal processing protease